MITLINQNNDSIIGLAPMDGITTPEFRAIINEINPNIFTYSEFTNVKRIINGDFSKIKNIKKNKNFIVQLFGNNPNQFALAGKILKESNYNIIDVNMGCPNKKIFHHQHGAALMSDSNLACEIISSLKEQGLVVSVKTRLGLNSADNLIEFVQQLEQAGLNLITIHGRTYNQKFNGQANWDPIYELKKHVVIPVLGNGDVNSISDGLNKQKNLDGFLIGRAAIDNPFLFAQDKNYDLKERVNLLEQQVELMHESIQPINIFKQIRKFYKGYFGASFIKSPEKNQYYKALLACENRLEFNNILRNLV